MHLLNKIFNSRKTLKDILSNEWIVDPIQELSLKELEILYNSKNEKTYLDSGCNITLINKFLPSHKLHIIYYNFPELHLTGTKINKTCCDKLNSLYKKIGFDNEDAPFEPEDSLLVIINEPVSDSIEKSIESMYLKGQQEIKRNGLSKDIISQIKSSNFNVDFPYFRNVHIFHIDTLINNLLHHSLVPNHQVIRDQNHINLIYKNTNSNSQLLPVIFRTDPIAKLLRLSPKDICKITRMSQVCGENIYYRICK